MSKRIISMLLSLMMLLGCAAGESAAGTETAEKTFVKKMFPFYVGSKDVKLPTDVPLYFEEGAEDLPYMNPVDWAPLLQLILSDGGKNEYELKVDVQKEKNMIILTRENGYHACFDFNEGIIWFDDYSAFVRTDNERYYDPASLNLFRRDGQEFLMTMSDSRNRYGDITELHLKEYRIPMTVWDGAYLVPLQTLAAFFMYPLQMGIYYNGRELLLNGIGNMKNPLQSFIESLNSSGKLTPEMKKQLRDFDGTTSEKEAFLLEMLQKEPDGEQLTEQYRQMKEASAYTMYTSVSPAKRSEALIEYGYYELCLELDSFYGLKESHSIKDFNTFFLQTGLVAGLSDPDAEKADQAVCDLTFYWLDDGHSGFHSHSWMAESDPKRTLGVSNAHTSEQGSVAEAVREEFPNADLPYYEVGDTAFITFDAFDLTPEGSGVADYYTLAENGELPQDTIGIIIQAHREITRENSPIKNVVLDLSCNGGGMASAAAYTLCWFLGDAQISIQNTFTGGQSTVTYKADVNLDKKFDENDTLAGRGLNLFCLISPKSFSCGNLVPWAFKADGSVTLLGRMSGGGSCVVRPITTAWGSTLQISGNERISFVKNGSYYDVDQGVEPDYIIHSYEHFYDREALAAFINGLY